MEILTIENRPLFITHNAMHSRIWNTSLSSHEYKDLSPVNEDPNTRYRCGLRLDGATSRKSNYGLFPVHVQSTQISASWLPSSGYPAHSQQKLYLLTGFRQGTWHSSDTAIVSGPIEWRKPTWRPGKVACRL